MSLRTACLSVRNKGRPPRCLSCTEDIQRDATGQERQSKFTTKQRRDRFLSVHLVANFARQTGHKGGYWWSNQCSLGRFYRCVSSSGNQTEVITSVIILSLSSFGRQQHRGNFVPSFAIALGFGLLCSWLFSGRVCLAFPFTVKSTHGNLLTSLQCNR